MGDNNNKEDNRLSPPFWEVAELRRPRAQAAAAAPAAAEDSADHPSSSRPPNGSRRRRRRAAAQPSASRLASRRRVSNTLPRGSKRWHNCAAQRRTRSKNSIPKRKGCQKRSATKRGAHLRQRLTNRWRTSRQSSQRLAESRTLADSTSSSGKPTRFEPKKRDEHETCAAGHAPVRSA